MNSHERVPLLLVPNRCEPRRDLVVLDDFLQPLQSCVLGVDCLGVRNVACRVFVPDVCDGLVRECA